MKANLQQYRGNLYQFGTTDIKWKNFLIVGVCILVFGFTLTFFGKKILEAIKNKIDETSTASEAKKEIIKEQLSHTESQYRTYADKLHRAFKGVGTDDKAVFEVFEQMKNRSDLMKLIAVFGSRETGWFFGSDKLTLSEWITAELSQGEIDKVNAILESKQINYTF